MRKEEDRTERDLKPLSVGGNNETNCFHVDTMEMVWQLSTPPFVASKGREVITYHLPPLPLPPPPFFYILY